MANHNNVAGKLMIDHNRDAMSESEEMYLITVARLVEQGVEEPVPLPRLAQELSILPVSANQMVHKLEEEELVAYIPYKGVELTPKGHRVAMQVLRHRRLWEVFLVDQLKLSPGEADALACRLEHITPQKATYQLAEFLGHPAVTPQGLPIPKAEWQAEETPNLPLAELPLGRQGEVMRIEADSATRAFLEAEGVRPGSQVCVLAVASDGGLLLQGGEKRIHLASHLAWEITVRVL
jgi:DtxR family Mn-dependent transcriptional regulator